MENVLEVNGLVKRYPNFCLDHISFSVPAGCIAGFIGTNGAGKTTTIRSILGLSKKDAGTIRVFGLDADEHLQEIKDRIGVVMDEGCFYEDLSMNQMKSILAPAYSKWSEEDYRTWMEKFGLDPRQKIATLSKGMKMKFALVLALSHRAELLVMDEPTGGLDPIVRSQFLDLLMDYMQSGGKGVFYSTHITSDLEKTADLLILIHEGKIIFQRDRDALLDAYRIIRGRGAWLNDENRKLIRNLKVTPYGFSGVTEHAEELKKAMPEAVFERASIEDIMIANIGR